MNHAAYLVVVERDGSRIAKQEAVNRAEAQVRARAILDAVEAEGITVMNVNGLTGWMKEGQIHVIKILRLR